MSYSGTSNGDFYANLNNLSLGSGQPLLMAGWINPNSLASEIGLFSLSNNASNGAAGNYFGLNVLTNGTLRFRFFNGVNDNTTSTTSAVTTGSWQHIAVFISSGFDGTSQTVKFYKDGSSTSSHTDTLGDYSSDDFISAQAGDGAFAVSNHFGAYIGLWAPANVTEADSIVSSLQTLFPSVVGTPLHTASFASGVPADYSANGGITIDSGENPTLSAGGGGSPRRAVALVI